VASSHVRKRHDRSALPTPPVPDAGGATRAMRMDERIATSLIVAHLALSVVLLPVAQYPLTIGPALLIYWLVARAARTRGRGGMPPVSVFMLAMASAAVLIVPALMIGPPVPAVVPLGFLGSQAATVLWVVRRWRPTPPAPAVTFGRAWKYGLAVALIVSIVATVPLVMVVREEGVSLPVLLVYPCYLVGFVGAATMYGLLQRVAHLATGFYLIGFLGGACVYGAAMPVVSLLNAEPLAPLAPLEMLGMALLIGAFAGPAGAFALGKRAWD
jgi:hypothetical protein